MSGSDYRVPAQFVELDTNAEPTEDSIQLEYSFPFVDITSESETSVQTPIGRPPVVKSFEGTLTQIDIQGHAYKDECQWIQSQTDGMEGLIRVYTDRWTGDAVIEDIQTDATGEGGGPRGGTEHRIYEYNMSLTELGGSIEDRRDLDTEEQSETDEAPDNPMTEDPDEIEDIGSEG